MALSIFRFGTRRATKIIERSISYPNIYAIHKISVQTNNGKHSLLTSNLFIREYSKRAGQKLETLNGYAQSQSESDSDDENIKKNHRAESDFWRRKMRTIHSLLDINKDGVISFDDFIMLADKFVNLGHLDQAHTDEFKQSIKELWEANWGEINPYNLVTVEQYLEDMHHVMNDKQLKRKVHNFLPFLFKAVDQDHDGEISVKEFILFFECLGVDKHQAIVSFSFIDTNSDGKLSLKEFLKHGRNFFVTENEDCVSKFFWGPLVK